MLKALFSKPYSRLFIVGDNSGWSTDIDARDLKNFADQLGVKASILRRAHLNLPQFVHYTSQFSLLLDIYKSKHRLSLDYYHGKPEQGENFRRCFEALREHREQIAAVRVSTKEMEGLIGEILGPEKVMRIPIGVDLTVFKPQTKEAKANARKKLGIKEGSVVIGSFQKDGSGWGEGMEPKLIKGPDIFLKVVEKLKTQIPQLHILLSGPSRGYIKQGLEKLGVPYTHRFLKDYRGLDELYDALDLYLITSREEGGPKAVLESMAKGIPLVTTAMGQAVDLVKNGENALMSKSEDTDALTQSALKILQDGVLAKRLIESGFETAGENSLDSQLPLWRKYFAQFMPKKTGVTIFHEFHQPPYGGGNQFLLALEKEFKKRGLAVKRNAVDENTGVVLFNSFNFDFEKLSKLKGKFGPMMIHRVDGPISVYRGENSEIDKKIWKMNHELAEKTIFQSQYSLDKHLEMGLAFKNATVIPNASDSEIFNTQGRISPPAGKRKTRLIATSWSDNPKKGGPTLAWLDEHLDTNKYELTFVGRTQAKFKNAKLIDAVPSHELARILKEHDIYIAPSQDDPCSNALIEALACGLPAVYLKSGGHPELARNGGVAFTGTDDLLNAIDKVADHFETYQGKIEVTPLSQVVDAYLKVME